MEATLKDLSSKPTGEFGKGFSVRNLERMRIFYVKYSKTTTVSTSSKSLEFTLSWSHYVELLRLDDLARKFYEIEAIKKLLGS